MVLLSMGPPLVAFAALFGVALRNEAPPWLGMLGAAALVGLPIAGVSGLFRHHRAALLGAMWLWPIAVLIAFPRWLPGERTPGLAEGFAWMAMPAGERAAEKVAGFGQRLGELLGPEKGLPVATPILEPTIVAQATPTDLLGEVPSSSVDGRVAGTGGGNIVLPYEGEGRSLKVLVTFDGPDFSEELPVLFDTGATFTTLDRGVLRSLGVEIPSDAPTATFQTANGKIVSPMVLLDRVWLGEKAIEGVTVAVCEDCSQEGTVGLLGLNVTSQFRTSLDHEIGEIVLEPVSDSPDRHLDVTHWLTIEGRATRWPTGRVVIDLTARSQAPVPVAEAVVEVECPASSFAVELHDVPPAGERSTRFELPRGTQCDKYRVILRTAKW